MKWVVFITVYPRPSTFLHIYSSYLFTFCNSAKTLIKKLGGTLVAKSLDKDLSKAATIWRLSLNPAPVFDKVTRHLKENHGCDAKKVLKLVKDLKRVALEGRDQDFLKSYNVKQALMHWADRNESQNIAEANLLLAILKKVSKFFEAFFPSFLEERCNLIFNFTPKLYMSYDKDICYLIMIYVHGSLRTFHIAGNCGGHGPQPDLTIFSSIVLFFSYFVLKTQ